MMAENKLTQQNRADRYIDFDQMEYMPELASALDIYADEMTTSNQYRQVLIIDSKNEEIKNILVRVQCPPFNLKVPFEVDYKPPGENWSLATYGPEETKKEETKKESK